MVLAMSEKTAAEKPDAPEQVARGPFNEISVLFPVLTIYTVAYLGLLAAEFFLRGAFAVPAGLMPVYIALVGAYAADKEIRRWAGAAEPPRKGAFFVYLWLLFFLGAFLLRSFRPEFMLPSELDKVVLQVLGIFFGSKASKYIYNARLLPEAERVAREGQEGQVIDLLKTRGRVTRKEVAVHLAVSPSTSYRLLYALEQQGRIRRKGDNKGTYYELVVS